MNRMFQENVFACIALLMASTAFASDVVARAENSDLKDSHDNAVPRVERDTDGNVIRLRLNNLRLSKENVEQLGQLKHLRSLVLFGTNVTDQELPRLVECRNLEHLNLTNTEVTDRCIATILKLTNLKSVCLGNVNVTPAGIEKLKQHNRTQGQSRQYLRWGYSQRKKRAD